MPEEVPALSGRLRIAAGVFVVAVLVVGIVLRFWTRSGLWLDEALTVDIARLPLHAIPEALKHDGAPPLYYYLLHFWISIFGQSDVAVRSLSGIIAVITLPVGWLCGRRFGGRAVAWTTLVLLASAPFAVYYGTESRMYALVILETGLGFLALSRALERPRLGNLVALAVVTAALLYTQYWSLYLVGVTGLWLLLVTVRALYRDRRSEAPLPPLGAIAVGCVLFLPWAPTFLYQSAHTSTPWAAPPNFTAVINALTGFTVNQGSLSAASTDQGRLLAIVYFGMLALALFGVGTSGRFIELDLHTRPRARFTTFVVIGTLFVAIGGGILTSSAFSSRYAAVVFLPLVLLVALGTTTLLNPKARAIVVAVAVLAGFLGAVENVTTQRTQATAVATAINAHAKAGDVVAFCPDQLGPAVYRQVRDTGRYDMLTFPRRTNPAIVDWVDYAKTVEAASARSFVHDLVARAGSSHTIWLVWAPGYQTYGIKCEDIAGGLSTLATRSGGGARNYTTLMPSKYYEPMNLTEFVFAG